MSSNTQQKNIIENDSCFVCLSDCKRLVCSQCNIRAHSKCWNEYVKHKKLNNMNNNHVECPQCKHKIECQNRPFTRSQNIFKVDDEETFVWRVKIFLIEIDNTHGKDNKLRIIKLLFEYLYTNKWFLIKYKKFGETVKQKLTDFILIDNFEQGKEYYMKIYNEKGPVY